MTRIRSRNLHGAEQEVSFPRKAGGARCPAYGVSERYILGHRMHYYSSEMVLLHTCGISIAPHTVGAVSNRTGPRPYRNQRHESSSVAHPSMNGLVFPRPRFLCGNRWELLLPTTYRSTRRNDPFHSRIKIREYPFGLHWGVATHIITQI